MQARTHIQTCTQLADMPSIFFPSPLSTSQPASCAVANLELSAPFVISSSTFQFPSTRGKIKENARGGGQIMSGVHQQYSKRQGSKKNGWGGETGKKIE